MKVSKKAASKGGFLFILLALVFTIGFPIFSHADTKIKRTPINRDFHVFLNTRSPMIADDGHSLGEIPSLIDLSHVKGKIDRRIGIERAIPSTYDLRTTGKLTPVKDQGACGSCWAFGTYASLESFLKPIETWDFYEDHLNRNHGFDIPACEGGNTDMALAYLARWGGPLDETNPTNLAPQKHIQQAVYLPTRMNFTDNDTIKNFVMNYGAVKASFYYSATYWNASTNSYYVSSGITTTNHAVAVVGWDDDYASANFNTAPPGNGAFIMKNSWGNSWGDNGYFYISYYDTSLKSFASFNNAEAADNYKAVYQYDPLGWVGNYGSGSTTAWGANIFTSTGRHAIAAVGFYTNDANTAYSIYIYTGVTAGQPTSGTLAATKTGTNIYQGYYTVKLDTPISLTNGANFSIVIRFVNTVYKYPVPLEYIEDGYSSAATSHTGESFFSSDGITWNDLYTNTYKDNNTIKAFIVTQTISGTVLSGGSPLSGVVMNGLPGNPTTNASGFYSAEVDYNWSGTVTPTRAGYSFAPTHIDYSSVTTDQLNQDYTATLLTYAISGTIKLSGVTPLAGVVMNGLPGNPTTDAAGFYLSTITYNGATVTPTLSGYAFTPTNRPYANVIANQPNQDYTAAVSSGGSSISPGGGGGGGGGGCFISMLTPNDPPTEIGKVGHLGLLMLSFLSLMAFSCRLGIRRLPKK
ncbi:MAG: surface layer protein B [Desulfobacteraceae bacterium]|nr:MAG: surface layer protein B [Desulfobacteraceae bacterium]